MKASGCCVLALVCLMVVLQTVNAGHEDDHEEGGARGRKCGHVLSKIDAGDLGMVITNNSITMRKLKANACALAAGLECGVPDKVKGRREEGMREKGGDGDHEGPRNGTEVDGGEGHGGQGQGQGQGGQGQGGEGGQGNRPEPERPGSTRKDGTKVCARFGKLTEFYIAAIELLDDQMVVQNSTTEIVHSQEADDTLPTADTEILGSQSESGPVKSTYTTVTVSAPGRQEGTTCKGKLQIYISAGKGNVTFQDIVSNIEKNEVKWTLEVTNTTNWFCKPDGSECASYIKIKICLKVQNGKKGGFNKKAGRACKNDPSKNCGQSLESDDGTRMEVPNKVRKDGQGVTLEGQEGKVSIDENDCIDIVIKRFTASLFMDPIMAATDEEEDLTDDTGDTSSNVARLVTSGFSMLVLAILAVMLTH